MRLAVPNIVSNLTVPLLTMVDLHLMGYLGASKFMGAVALGGVIFNMIYAFFAFLRMSLSGMTAQAFGRSDSSQQNTLFMQGLFVAIVGSLFILLFQKPIASLSFYLLQGSELVESLAYSYYSIRIWAAPAVIALLVFNGWFLGMQNAVFPMLTSIIINIINIVVSIVCVRYFDMEVRGVALGSVVAQYAGLLLSVIMYFAKYHHSQIRVPISQWLKLNAFKQFAGVSRDIIIRTLSIVGVFVFFTSASASFGDDYLAANTVLLQFLFLISYFLDGYAYAAEAIVGQYVGSKNILLLKKSIRHLLGFGLAFGVIFSILYFVAGTPLLTVFTNNQVVIDIAQNYLLWLVVLPLLGFAAYIWDGIYIGATASVEMRNSMILSVIAFFVCYYIGKNYIGNHALWMAMCVFMTLRGVLQSLFYKRVLKNSGF